MKRWRATFARKINAPDAAFAIARALSRMLWRVEEVFGECERNRTGVKRRTAGALVEG